MNIQNKEIREEYYKLVLNIRNSNPEEAIIKLTDFYNKHSSKDEDNKIRNAIIYGIADNLKKQEKSEEALAKFKELLIDPLVDDLAYHTALLRILEIHIQFDEREEAIKLAIDYLNAKHNSPFYYLNILSWYVKNVESSEEGYLEKYRTLVEKIFQDLEFAIEDKDLKKSILYLAEENHKSNRKYSEIIVLSGRIPKEELKKLLEEYIKVERIGFYKGLALKYFREMESAGK